jgi:hypothetical protein
MPVATPATIPPSPTAPGSVRDEPSVPDRERADIGRTPDPVVEIDDDHEGIGDQAMGRVFVVGTAVGVPLTWVVATVLMLPWGLAVAAPAAIFVGIASGPFFGAAVFLMAKILRQESQGR